MEEVGISAQLLKKILLSGTIVFLYTFQVIGGCFYPLTVFKQVKTLALSYINKIMCVKTLSTVSTIVSKL